MGERTRLRLVALLLAASAALGACGAGEPGGGSDPTVAPGGGGVPENDSGPRRDGSDAGYDFGGGAGGG